MKKASQTTCKWQQCLEYDILFGNFWILDNSSWWHLYVITFAKICSYKQIEQHSTWRRNDDGDDKYDNDDNDDDNDGDDVNK